MPKAKLSKAKKTSKTTQVKVSRGGKVLVSEGFFEKLQSDIQQNNSLLNIILGALILVVLGVLIFNYFNKNNGSDLGPSQQTQNLEQTDQAEIKEDVAKENLPGKYTVKEGDTLFLIAEKYYDDGFKYNKLVEANKLADENNIEVGQTLDIPKIEDQLSQATPLPTTGPTATPQAQAQAPDNGTGGAENQTIWGEKITGNSYTVQAEDWLSKIAGRAYGDIMQYEKIAKANNITNVDIIEPGTILKIPR